MNKKAMLKAYIRARKNEVDEKHLDPEQRATLVHTFLLAALGKEILPDPITGDSLWWDMVCFSLEFTNQCVSNMGIEEAMLAQKVINDLVYNIHYSTSMKALGPGRDEEERIWVERIEWQKNAYSEGLPDNLAEKESEVGEDGSSRIDG